ncbi:hypothetical protein BN1723_004477 [Verticillium longisporum]|uniref:ubiquitinyl hydrolase 1 n=1 Tax=Verticillium longisporum TaxID=100787 RepID=A0A0G4MXD2_VERLO|nr:hypothetical protein BN1723_004477 [Verticillium longisporum]
MCDGGIMSSPKMWTAVFAGGIHVEAPSAQQQTLWARIKVQFRRVGNMFDRADKRIGKSTFGRIFRLEGSGHPKEVSGATFFKEVRAGFTTFATMAYIIAVNAIILSQTGGTCPCDQDDRLSCDSIDSYKQCKERVRLDLITATAAISGLSSFLFGFMTNLPVALAFAKSSPFVDETQRGDEGGEDAFHFVAYSSIGGKLYELDGLQPAPISHGDCTPDEFPVKISGILSDRVATYASSEIRFNVLAMVRDPRIAAAEIGDQETIARESEKRRQWQWENALRRHNFVGFAGEVMKGVVGEKVKAGNGAYEAWIKEGLERRKRDEDATRLRRRMGGGDGDEEMIG